MKLSKFSEQCINRYQSYIDDIDYELEVIEQRKLELLNDKKEYQERIKQIEEEC